MGGDDGTPSRTDLGLGFDDDEEHPVRMVPFPSPNGDSVDYVCHGGDDGIITVVRAKSVAASNEGTSRAAGIRLGNPRVVRTFDDEVVRAVAVSHDGKRVAVGFQSGSTMMYSYEDFDGTKRHPFCRPMPVMDSPFASQTFSPDHSDKNSLADSDNETDNWPDNQSLVSDDEHRTIVGPQLQAPVRQILFLPTSNHSNGNNTSSSNNNNNNNLDGDYYVAIATEHSFSVVNAKSATTIRDTGRLLERVCEEHHSGSGIRGMAYHPRLGCLATLSMDGRLCLWDLSPTATAHRRNRNDGSDVASPSHWKLAHKENHKCVLQPDTGEAFGADSYDRSCRPLFVHLNSPPSSNKASSASQPAAFIVTPGQLDPTVRHVSRSTGNGNISVRDVVLKIQNKQLSAQSPEHGHLEAIVQLATSGASSSRDAAERKNIVSFISNGRCGRLVRWTVATQNCASPTTTARTKPRDKEVYECQTVCRRLTDTPTMPAVDMQYMSAPNLSSPKRLLMADSRGKCLIVDIPDDPLSLPASSSASVISAMKNASVSAGPQARTASASSQDSGRLNGNIDDILQDSDDERDDDAVLETQPPNSRVAKRANFLDDEAQVDDDGGTVLDGSNVGGLDTAGRNEDLIDNGVSAHHSSKITSSSPPDPEAGLAELLGDHDNGSNEGTGGGVADVGNSGDGTDNMSDPLPQDGNIDENSLGETPRYTSTAASRQHTSRVVQAVPPQAPFAPSATPLDLQRRFLCWNHIGTVTLLQPERLAGPMQQQHNTVDITFTDSAFRRPVSFTDNQGFIMGSLGEDGGIFATDVHSGDDDDDDAADDDDDLLNNDELDNVVGGMRMSERIKEAVRRSRKKSRSGTGPGKDSMLNPTGSSIYFHRFETFGLVRDKDWYLTLPDGERALGTACGEGWAAVATSRRFLRFFTSGGNQSQPIWLQGDVVCMAGRSRFLSVVYHVNTPKADGTQQMGYSMYDASDFRLIAAGSMSCISNEAGLAWLGFSNDCCLMAMDTDGMLSMLTPTRSSTSSSSGDSQSDSSYWEWTPVLDTVGLRKSSEDRFWPVTVNGGKLVCVPLKGGNEYPDATRRPITTALGLRLPLARSAIAKHTLLEEVSVRSNMALRHKRVMNDISPGDADEDELEQEYNRMCAQVDKVTLKLFAAVVDAGKAERALDLVDRLHLEKSYEIAAAIAGRYERLVDLIEEARASKFADFSDGEGSVHEDEDEDRLADDGRDGRNGVRERIDRRKIVDRQVSDRKRPTGFDAAQVSPVSEEKRLFEFTANPIQKKRKLGMS